MASGSERLELHCPHCGAVEECGPSMMLGRLQQLGMFRRAAEPPWDMLRELFLKKVGHFVCQQCGRADLQARESAADGWNEARYCAACNRRIPQERVELFPNADLCAACQQAADARGGAAAEYCPKCGNVMRMRPVYGRGITRYALRCPHCRS